MCGEYTEISNCVCCLLFEALHKFVVVGNGSQRLTRLHRVELISSVQEYENWSARQKNYSAEWPWFFAGLTEFRLAVAVKGSPKSSI